MQHAVLHFDTGGTLLVPPLLEEQDLVKTCPGVARPKAFAGTRTAEEQLRTCTEWVRSFVHHQMSTGNGKAEIPSGCQHTLILRSPAKNVRDWCPF